MYKVIRSCKVNNYLNVLTKTKTPIFPVCTTILRSKSSSLNEIGNRNNSVLQRIERIIGVGTLINRKRNISEFVVEKAPLWMQPYLKIMRIDRPIGYWLLFWPCTWSITLATAPGSLPDIYLLSLFGIGSIIMRGAGCIINDLWDRDIDGKVARTANRPLVNGTMNVHQAFYFLAGQMSVGLLILLQLNWYSVMLGASSLGLVITYPLMKRITHWPQIILGLTFNWGVLLGYAAVQGYVNWTVCAPLYAAAICWAIMYDTIYAHQDISDDILLGVKSTAILFRENTKYWLSGFTTLITAGLTTTGIMAEQTWPYYSAVAIITSQFVWQIYTLNIHDPKDCLSKFKSNHYVGLILFCGILVSNLLKKSKSNEQVSSNDKVFEFQEIQSC